MTTRTTGNTRRIPDRVPVPDINRSVKHADIHRKQHLDSGGTAEVYRATLAEGGEPVALKEPHYGSTSTEDSRARFQSGIKKWARLDSHDHIVSVLDYGYDPHPWIALEYMDAGTLADRSPASVAEVTWITKCIADALQHAHKHGVAHLDLKPKNVLFRETSGDAWPVPKVSDWGLARVLLEGDVDTPVTPAYAAPEHHAPESYGQPDDSTDIYQLGLVFYELLAGEGPATEPAVGPNETPPTVSGALPSGADSGLSDRIDAVLDRALASKKTERYETMADFRRDLERLLELVVGDENKRGISSDSRGRGPALPSHHGSTNRTDPETQGFVRITDQYFAERSPGAPLRAWQTGFSLSEVYAGYATERTIESDGKRVRLAATLCERLEDGIDVALIGPSGCGKSTVCKSVACAWHERDNGPVLYRESNRTARFDQPGVLERAVRSQSGHTLVVVEDAVQPDVPAVFEFIWSVADRTDVTVLLDSRDSDWHDYEDQLPPELNAYRHESVETVRLPQPDEQECERLVRHFQEITDTRIGVSADQFVAEVRAERTTDIERSEGDQMPPSRALLLLSHRLVMTADPTEPDERQTTRLKESAKGLYDTVREAGSTQIDVAILANLLNAAGVAMTPDLLYALATDGTADAVEEATDRLDGTVIFRDRDEAWETNRGVPTVHRAWSITFLAHALEREDERAAHERVARCVNTVFERVTSVEHRKRIEWYCHGDTPTLDTVATNPVEWVEQTVESIFRIGRDWPKLAPLFGNPSYSRFELPDDCSPETRLRCMDWRGEMYSKGGWYDRAEQAFEQLRERAASTGVETEARADRWHARALRGLGHAAWQQSEFERARDCLERALTIYKEIEDEEGESRCLKHLGIVARKQGNYDSAEEYQERSLRLISDQGDTLAKARRLNELGAVAWSRGEYETAEKRYQRSLEIRQEEGDRSGVEKCVSNLGTIQFNRGDYDAAEERYRRSLAICEEIGDRHGKTEAMMNLGLLELRRGDLPAAKESLERALEINREHEDTQSEARCINNLGVAAENQGDLATAREYYQQALGLYREVGDRNGKAVALQNLGEIQYKRGYLETARERIRTGLELRREMGDRSGEAACLYHLANVARKRGNVDRARTQQRRALELARETGDRRYEGRILSSLGALAIENGEYDAAAKHLAESLSIRMKSGEESGVAECHYQLGRLAIQQEHYDAAAAHLNHAAAIADDIGDEFIKADVWSARGQLACQQDAPAEAKDAYERAVTLYRAADAVADELDATRTYVRLCVQLDAISEALSACETGLHLAERSGFDAARSKLEEKKAEILSRLDE